MKVQEFIGHSREANSASYRRMNAGMLAAERAWPLGSSFQRAMVCNQVETFALFNPSYSQSLRKASICKRECECCRTFLADEIKSLKRLHQILLRKHNQKEFGSNRSPWEDREWISIGSKGKVDRAKWKHYPFYIHAKS